MSLLFPVHRPRLGLSFAERSLALVEVRRGRRHLSIVRVQERPLSEGLLSPSAAEPNIKDRNVLVRELRALLASTSERTLSICLPDRVCHLAIFPFETIPGRERDREPILRYRFQHDEHVSLARDTQIMQRVFPVTSQSASLSREVAGGRQVAAFVLTMAIRRSVLDEYRSACEEAGFLPMSISCASLWRFDFCQPVMPQDLEVFFANCAPDALTILAIRQGMPMFCRSKVSRRESVDVLRELRSTVQYYDDCFPSAQGRTRSGTVPIYVLGGHRPDVKTLVETDPTRTSDRVAMTESFPWHLQLVQPDWKAMIQSDVNHPQSEDEFSALACASG